MAITVAGDRATTKAPARRATEITCSVGMFSVNGICAANAKIVVLPTTYLVKRHKCSKQTNKLSLNSAARNVHCMSATYSTTAIVVVMKAILRRCREMSSIRNAAPAENEINANDSSSIKRRDRIPAYRSKQEHKTTLNPDDFLRVRTTLETISVQHSRTSGIKASTKGPTRIPTLRYPVTTGRPIEGNTIAIRDDATQTNKNRNARDTPGR